MLHRLASLHFSKCHIVENHMSGSTVSSNWMAGKGEVHLPKCGAVLCLFISTSILKINIIIILHLAQYVKDRILEIYTRVSNNNVMLLY